MLFSGGEGGLSGIMPLKIGGGFFGLHGIILSALNIPFSDFFSDYANGASDLWFKIFLINSFAGVNNPLHTIEINDHQLFIFFYYL